MPNHKRPDGLDPRSREARRLRGKPIMTMTLHCDTMDKLRKLSSMLGMSHNDTIKFLLDNRPELSFVPDETEAPAQPYEDPPKRGRPRR